MLQGLCAAGHDLGTVTALLTRVTPDRVDSFLYRRSATVTLSEQSDIAAVYRRLAFTVPTGPDADERRRAAAARQWLPPMAWDEDGSIYDPATKPAHKLKDVRAVDDVAVELAIAGRLRPGVNVNRHWSGRLARIAAIEILDARPIRLTDKELGERLATTERNAARMRQEIRQQRAAAPTVDAHELHPPLEDRPMLDLDDLDARAAA